MTWSGARFTMRFLLLPLLVGMLLVVRIPTSVSGGSAAAAAPPGAACGTGYVPAWHASPSRLTAVTGLAGQSPIVGQTLRLVIHPHTGGDKVRVRLSNRYGEAPITLGPVYAGIVEQGARLVDGSNRPVTFGGQPTVTLAAGADAVSDPIDRPIQAFQNVAVSVYVPAAAAPITGHEQARQTSFLSGPGNYASATGADTYRDTIVTWPFLSGLEVRTERRVNTVVTLGDSITDGDGSTPDANHRWPDYLAHRLTAAGGKQYMAVANAGIGANQILRDAILPFGGDSAVRRFSRDVVAQSGVTDVILHEGTNDIGLSGASAEEIIAGMKQLAAQAHTAGLRIHATTQTPAGGATFFVGHSSASAVATREAVNDWVRTRWREYFDGFIDFGAMLADPDDHTRLADVYNSGDGLHPNDAGYARMAAAVDLATLTGSPCLTARSAG